VHNRIEQVCRRAGGCCHPLAFAFAFGTGWLGVVRIHARRGVLGVEPSWLGSESTREGQGAAGWEVHLHPGCI